ncbi:hypothetical protein [Campylobacter sp. CCUG 57310]|uniref:hypothetical protein n=1 Tax=Campylobacter sp. CCUG 57310 TaxID=2517362 RepID=UPI0015660192|nr:hypothetical protein [Campylobacter sp. CCUG 57310]QKF91985.1 hypothetical protein CORI_0783 [Campylobacter sp. CCUG 57310]
MVLYSAVIYPSDFFDVYIEDYFRSVFGQTNQNFELLLILDGIDKFKIEKIVKKFNFINKKIHVVKFLNDFSPIELRQKQIEIAHEIGADILILSDFDESVALNRVEEILKNIKDYAFAFNDFYIVDHTLNRLDAESFFYKRKINREIVDYKEISSFNFIGLGSMALNLRKFNYSILKITPDIKALDWYMATIVLLNRNKGIALHDTYANYRQHKDSFVGFDFKLNDKKLKQGIEVKLSHYKILKEYSKFFCYLYNEIVELNEYLLKFGTDKYIELVNSSFDTDKFCWWENIKTKKELGI